MGNTPLEEGPANMPEVDQLLREPGCYDVADQSSSGDPFGHSLLEYQGKTYMVTFYRDDPDDDAHFEQLPPVPWAIVQAGNPN